MAKYKGSDGTKDMDIETMPYTYMKNALAKLPAGRDQERADLTAEIAKRDAAHASKNAISAANLAMDALSSRERMEVLKRFCHACGDPNPECPCWNDE